MFGKKQTKKRGEGYGTDSEVGLMKETKNPRRGNRGGGGRDSRGYSGKMPKWLGKKKG